MNSALFVTRHKFPYAELGIRANSIHRYKEIQNKAKKVVGIVNFYEVQCADGTAPTVQLWCPRNIQTVEQAVKECPCQFKEGQKLVVEFDLMEPNTFDAKNGVIIRAGSVLSLEGHAWRPRGLGLAVASGGSRRQPPTRSHRRCQCGNVAESYSDNA